MDNIFIKKAVVMALLFAVGAVSHKFRQDVHTEHLRKQIKTDIEEMTQEGLDKLYFRLQMLQPTACQFMRNKINSK